METRTGQKTSSQITKMGAVINLSTADFELTGNDKTFLVKNDATDPVTLAIVPALSDTVVTTVFQPGWNPELIRKIKTTATTLNLKWGV